MLKPIQIGNGLLDLFVCNYVRWSPENDIDCESAYGKRSYCVTQAYRATAPDVHPVVATYTRPEVFVLCALRGEALGQLWLQPDRPQVPDCSCRPSAIRATPSAARSSRLRRGSRLRAC